ncbi:MAG: M48 family metalloprotease [bacterium]
MTISGDIVKPFVLAAYFVVSPVLAAALVSLYAQRAARRTRTEPRETMRRYGRLFGIPWCLYLVNIAVVAALTAGSATAARRAPVMQGGMILLGLLPMLAIVRLTRQWERSIGHPGGSVSARVEIRAWFAHAVFMSVTLGAAGALLTKAGVAVTLLSVSLFIAAYLSAYPDIFRWILRATPLGDVDLYRDILALAEREEVPVRDVLLIPRARGGGMNAYASGFLDRRRYIFVTERLLCELPPAEVLAVVAHEIGHLKYRHVGRVGVRALITSVTVGAALALIVSFATADTDGALRRTLFAFTGALTAFASLATTRRLLRRFEFEADAFATHAMGSPEPMANALRRLAQENWLSEDTLEAGALASHPTIRRRLLMLQERPGVRAVAP